MIVIGFFLIWHSPGHHGYAQEHIVRPDFVPRPCPVCPLSEFVPHPFDPVVQNMTFPIQILLIISHLCSWNLDIPNCIPRLTGEATWCPGHGVVDLDGLPEIIVPIFELFNPNKFAFKFYLDFKELSALKLFKGWTLHQFIVLISGIF